jgi:hypothetical protein
MTDPVIVPIPRIPPQILEAINNNELAIFFGAGTSRLIGCSSWDRLAENLIEKCFTTQKKGSPTSTCINFKERDALLKMQDPKKIITICQYVLHNNESDTIFYNEIEQSLKPDKSLVSKQNIYSELHGLRGLFITTNIDTHFDQRFPPSQIIYQKGDFDPDDVDESKLYHIHGSISKWSSVVITVKQYFDRYNDPQFRSFLQKIFEAKVILFIGYGLSEFEVLDFLITKSKSKPSEKPRHFILLPYFSGEDTLLEFERHYFSEMGVSVIAYRKDEKGYGQLFDIIKKWNQDILRQSRFLHDKYEDLKESANNYSPESEGKVFQSIRNDKVLEFEFFKQLSASENPSPWLKPLKDNGYFEPSKNPVPHGGAVPYWTVMGALENIAKVNNVHPIKEITDEIISIINSIIDYRDGNEKRIENFLTDRHLIRIIFLLPLNLISDYYFKFIKNVLHIYHERIIIAGEIGESIIPRLLDNNNQELVLKILDILLDFEKCSSPAFEEYPSVLGQYYLEVVLEKYSEKIIKLCGLSAIDIALKKIEQIVADDPSQFHNIWLPTLKENSEFEERYDHQIIFFIMKAFKQLDQELIKEKTKELLSKDHPIFKRIALAIIDNNYSAFKELFWQSEENPLAEYQIQHEVYDLFSNHCTEFSNTEIDKIVEWIDAPIYHEEGIEGNEREKYLAYCKKEWLSSLLQSNNPIVKTLFDKYNSINPAVISHPGRSFVVESFSGLTSPLSSDELMKKTNSELVEFLNNYRDEMFGQSRISTHSLGDIFRQCIIENPQKFTEDLNPFLGLHRVYQYELFLGLSEAWRKDKKFRWVGLIQFINSIIASEDFWKDSHQEGESNYSQWIIGCIANLLEEGTQKDTHVLELELLPEVEKILIVLAKRTESDLYPSGDLVNSVLNSNKGKIYLAMINYSLCYGRNYRKNENVRWPEAIKKEFEERLNPIFEPTVEYSVTLGRSLPNLCYLDKEWVRANINKVFSQDDDVHWNAAFTSYLFHSNVYKNLYVMLKENGHYTKAITTEFKDPHINEHLVQHICIGYLEGFERLDDDKSLIVQLLNQWNSKQIIEIIRFLRWFGKKGDPEKRPLILPLWGVFMSKISQDPDNADNIAILSELNDWISLVDELSNEICEWLKISAKYIKSYDLEFIEQLVRHTDLKPKCCSEILIIIIESGHYFEYQKEKIIELVTKFYEKNEKINADTICNLYLQVGFDFLKPTYEKNL